MKKLNKILKNSEKAITLIALVVTIIVLLILAGISISMLSGDNGILQKATDSKTQTEIGQEKETIALAYNSALAKKIGNGDTSPVNDGELRNELNSYSEIDNVEKNNEDIVVTFKSNRSYLVKSNGEISKQNNINISGLVVNNESTEVADGSKSVALNTPLTINFEASITEGSITSISPTVPYTTNGTETSKTFTITGTGGVTKEYTVNLKGYYNMPNLKVGDFVNYALKTQTTEELAQLNSDIATYSGASEEESGGGKANELKTAVGSTLLCRVLEIDSNGNPTKLISANGVNTLVLDGANGYNNAVYLINEMCKTLYSGNQGTTRNLTIEDLEKDFFDSTALDSAKGSDYGKKFRYTGNYAKYPLLAAKEKRMGINTSTETEEGNIFNILNTSDESLDFSEQERSDLESGGESIVGATNGITVTYTSYSYYEGDSNYKNAILNNILYKCPTESSNDVSIKSYWLASRCVDQYANRYCRFLVRVVDVSSYASYVTTMYLFRSDSTYWSRTFGVRPLINLNSGIQAEYVEQYNDTYNTWNLN